MVKCVLSAQLLNGFWSTLPEQLDFGIFSFDQGLLGAREVIGALPGNGLQFWLARGASGGRVI